MLSVFLLALTYIGKQKRKRTGLKQNKNNKKVLIQSDTMATLNFVTSFIL